MAFGRCAAAAVAGLLAGLGGTQAVAAPQDLVFRTTDPDPVAAGGHYTVRLTCPHADDVVDIERDFPLIGVTASTHGKQGTYGPYTVPADTPPGEHLFDAFCVSPSGAETRANLVTVNVEATASPTPTPTPPPHGQAHSHAVPRGVSHRHPHASPAADRHLVPVGRAAAHTPEGRHRQSPAPGGDRGVHHANRRGRYGRCTDRRGLGGTAARAPPQPPALTTGREFVLGILGARAGRLVVGLESAVAQSATAPSPVDSDSVVRSSMRRGRSLFGLSGVGRLDHQGLPAPVGPTC